MWQVPEVHVTAQALLPSTSVIAFTLGNGLSFTTFVNTVPINENRTVNRFALIRRLSMDKLGIFNMDAWDRFARQAMIRCGRCCIHFPDRVILQMTSLRVWGICEFKISSS